MNWTGGRLRRHSEINPKNRRRTVVKPVLPYNTRGPHQISLFDSFRRFRGDQSKKTEQSKCDDSTSPQKYTSTSSGLENQIWFDEHSKAPSRIEHLKRQLLKTADWGALSAAQPLTISFTPTEELERFGKRRKLTNDDHRRLKISPKPRSSQRVTQDMIGDMSSESMILDHEDSLRTSISDNSLPFIMSDGETSKPIFHTPRNIPGFQENTTRPEERSGGGAGLQSYDRNLVGGFVKSLARPRFTIEDQAIAAVEGNFHLSSIAPEQPLIQLGNKPAFSDLVQSSPEITQKGINFQTLNDIRPDSLSTHPENGWFPEQFCNIQRPESQIFHSGSTPTPLVPQSHSNFALLTNGTREQHTLPIRIFGQSVTFKRTGIIPEILQSSNFEANLHSTGFSEEEELALVFDRRAKPKG